MRTSRFQCPVEKFSKMQDEAFIKLYDVLLAQKSLQPLDLVLLLRIAAASTQIGGRCEISVSALADVGGQNLSRCKQAIKRLKDHDLLRKGKKGTGYFWMVNPEIFNRANGTEEGRDGKNGHEAWMRRYHALDAPQHLKRAPRKALQAASQAA